jgi:hypothetical protein
MQRKKIYLKKHFFLVIFILLVFLANFPLENKAIVRTLSVCLSPLLVFRGLTDWGDLWLDRKLMVQGSELW